MESSPAGHQGARPDPAEAGASDGVPRSLRSRPILWSHGLDHPGACQDLAARQRHPGYASRPGPALHWPRPRQQQSQRWALEWTGLDGAAAAPSFRCAALSFPAERRALRMAAPCRLPRTPAWSPPLAQRLLWSKEPAAPRTPRPWPLHARSSAPAAGSAASGTASGADLRQLRAPGSGPGKALARGPSSQPCLRLY